MPQNKVVSKTRKQRSVSAPSLRRRSQAERSASTRQRVLSTAIKLLEKEGYSGASTLEISRVAGLSLGALQHQFPTKAVLMVAVLRQFTLQNLRTVRESIRGIWEPQRRLAQVMKCSWDLVYTPELIAELEIILAARSDPELAREIELSMARQQRFFARMTQSLIGRVAGSDRTHIESLHLLNIALVRGMALGRVRGLDAKKIEAVRKLWHEIMLEQAISHAPQSPIRKQSRKR